MQDYILEKLASEKIDEERRKRIKRWLEALLASGLGFGIGYGTGAAVGRLLGHKLRGRTGALLGSEGARIATGLAGMGTGLLINEMRRRQDEYIRTGKVVRPPWLRQRRGRAGKRP